MVLGGMVQATVHEIIGTLEVMPANCELCFELVAAASLLLKAQKQESLTGQDSCSLARL